MLGNTLQTTPDYLRQLKQSDHNVLYSEVCNLKLDLGLVVASCGFAILVVVKTTSMARCRLSDLVRRWQMSGVI